MHIHLINIQHSIYRINHVQSVYIFRYTPAMFRSLFVIYPLGRWPSGNITNKFLTAGVYLTYTPLGHGLYITYLSIYLFPISIVSQVAQLQTAVVNGTYYSPHYLLFIPYLPIPLCLDFRPLNIVFLLTDTHDEQVVLTDSLVLLTDSNEKQISG